MVAVFRDPQLQESFEAQGYVKVPLLDAARIGRLTQVFQDLHPVAPENFSTSISEDSSAQKQRIQQAIFEVFLPLLTALLVDYRPLIGSFLSKRQGEGSKLDFHQDWSFIDETSGSRSLNVWCPLVATGAENGNLCIIPGTHRLPRAPRIAPASEFPYDAYRALYEPLARAIPTAAGEAIIYDGALFHGSPANMTAQTRLVAGLLMIPKAALGVLHFKSPEGQYQEYLADADFYLAHNPLRERPQRLLRLIEAPAPMPDPETALREVLGLTAPTASRASIASPSSWWRRLLGRSTGRPA